MYIPIGDNLSVRQRSVIGIFDLENCSYSKHTRSFLKQAEKEGTVVPVCRDIPKTFVLTREFGMDRVYLCQFSSNTLEKRISP